MTVVFPGHPVAFQPEMRHLLPFSNHPAWEADKKMRHPVAVETYCVI